MASPNPEPQFAAAPDHVPAELVRNIDLNVFTADGDDPYLAAARLHEGPDIFWAPVAAVGAPAWVPTRHALIKEIYMTPEIFSSDRQNLAVLGVDWKLNPLEYDPPEHSKYRRIVNPYFTPKAMAALDDTVRQTCDTLIAKFADRGSCEFIGEFAEALPTYIFLDLMGMPREKMHDFLEWEQGMIRATNPMDRFTAMKAVLDYMETFIADQRQNATTDVMQGILAGTVDDGRPLNDGEVMGMCYLLYIGGLDTVFSTLGWVMRYLAMDHALQQRLRQNPADTPRAVEELLRAFPVATPHRHVTRDVNFHGVELRKGDTMLIPTYLAARDERAYENPHVIDIDRNASHLTFANGPHICLGIHLARREIRAVVDSFLAAFDNIRIPEGQGYEFHTGGVFGVDKLPLEWD